MRHDHRSFHAPATGAAASNRAASIGEAYGGSDVADRVRRFLPMVKRLAWHVHGTGRPGIELDDLMQAGLVALTECAQRHPGPGEDGFAAYAKMRVRGAMVDLVRRQVPLSRGAAERRRQLHDAERTLRMQLGRAPDAAELGEALGIAGHEVAALQAAGEPLRFESLDDIYSDSNAAFADARGDSFELIAGEELRRQVVAAIGALPERLQLVIQLYFVEELNLSEIAQVLSVSIPRVHQLKAQAIAQLRKALEGSVQVV